MLEDLAAEMKQEQDRNEKIFSSAVQSYGVNPDQHASNVKLARKAGMPPALMPEINEDARLRVLLDQIDLAPPAVTKFVSDPENLKVSHDDIENMSALERTFDVLKKAGRSLASTPWSVSSGLSGVLQAAGEIDDTIAAPLRNLWSQVTGIEPQEGALTRYAKSIRSGAKDTAEAIKGDTSGAGLLERGLYSGVESLGQNLLTLPLTIMSGGSATPMLASMSATTGGQAYGEARDKGIGVLPSLSFGASQGAIEYATEMLPALALVNNLKAKSGLMHFAKDYIGKELVGEEAATLMQDLNEWAVLNPDKPFSSYLADRPAAFAETAIATLVGSGGMVVTAKGLEKIGASVDKYQTATDNKNFLLALGDGVQASKLRERMPEKMQELIKSMKEEHGTPEHAYIDANKLTELWQSQGLDPQVKAAEMFSDPSGYAEALATGSEVAIPLEEFAQRFTGEAYYKALIEDVRLGAGSSTMKEAEEWEKSGRDEAIKELIEEADGIAPTPSDLKVYDDVVGQLLGTGMERQTAERNALVMKAVFRTLAARTGLDAHELFKEYGLKVTRPLPEVLAKRLSVDLSLDPLLDRLREGNIPKDKDVRGKSLSEYLRKQGVKDDGGELAALDPDSGIKGKARKMIKADGLEMDRARLVAIEDGYLPEGATIRDFLDAISNDLAGRGVYSVNNLNSQLFDEQMSLTEMKEFLDALDIDVQGMTNDEVKAKLFFQETNNKRAFIRFGADRQFNIGFLENADLSSFLHESAHFYFEIMADLAGKENAPQQIVGDYNTLLKYVGAANREAITAEQHETIARSFEAYLMEGKAPSVELQSVFSRMKAWLVQVYREIRKLNVKLNDDVRGVFDRLVASDEEIEAARTRQGLKEVFATAEDMGVSEAEFAIYRKQGEKVHAAQIEKLEKEYMAEMTRLNEKWWNDGLKKMADEVDGETQDYPVYIAVQVLTKGVTFSGEVAELKLDRKTLEKQYGKTLVKRLPRGIFGKEGGLSADQVAEMTGFESGQEMIEAMITAPSRKEYVKAEADRRMRALHGDMLTDGSAADEATLAVHTDEQAKVLHEELRAMRKLQVTAEKVSRAKEGENRAARKESLGAIPPAEFFKDLARDMVAKKTIEELLPHRYQQAEAKAAREAFEAAGKKKWAEAAEAKQRQILNHYLYKESANIKKMVDKQVGKWNDLVKKSDKRLAASRDMNIVTAARAVLAAYGIGDSPDKALAALNLVQQYDPNLYESLQMAVDVATQEPKPWKKLQLTEFIGLMDAVNNLWHLSRRSKIAMIDGQAVGLDEINDDLHLQIGGRARPFAGMGKTSAVTDLQKLKIGFLGMGAALKRVEHWTVEMDRGDSGPFHNFILRPIYNAVTQYKAEKKPVIEKLRDIFSRLDKDTFADKKIAAPELGYTFKNKGELLHAVLHTGNESNLKKLLVGRNWADAENEQRALDRSRWDAFLDRMHKDGTLTEADYVFAQEVWDLLESTKAGAQKAHHDMYGYYFAEITAEPVVTPFGTFRGGYVPAITDPYLVESAAERADQENLLQDNASSMFPATTGKGFTMSRVAGYNKPLLLDLGLMATHVDKVLRFSYMGPAIQDVGRILNNSELKETFAEINPAWSSEMLIPWLKRTARQTVETKSSGWGGKAADAVFRGLRRRTGLQLMAANIANAAQQLTGLFPTMTKVSPGKVGAALVQFTLHPMELTTQVTDKSPWMRDRLDNEIGNISGELRDILTQSKYEKAQEFGMQAGYWVSGAAQHIVDVITWQAAYDQKVAEGEDEKESVQYADSIVRQTQGSFAPEDASTLEAGSPFVRLFTQFYSYFNMISNLAITEGRNAVAESGWKGGSSRLFYIYMMTFALPSFIAELIMAGMRGKIDDDGDGEYLDDILMMFFTGQGRAATALIPGVGQVINAAVGRFTKAPQDDRMSVSPAIGAIEGSVGVGKDLYDVLLDGKELKRAHVRDVFTLVGMVTGLPFAAAARPLGYMVAEQSGATDPANNIDYIRGLMTGYAPK